MTGGLVLLIFLGLISLYIVYHPPRRTTAVQKKILTSSTIPEWTTPRVETTTPWYSRHKNSADEKMRGLPAGARLVEVDGKQACLFMPDGSVLTPIEVDAVVYEKRPRFITGEVRPWISGGAVGTITSLEPSAAAGVDVLKLAGVHTGMGISVAPDAVSALLVASYGVYRNIDVRLGGGYGTAGTCGYAGVSIAIE